MAQTTYLPLNAEEYQILERLETFSGKNAMFSSAFKPISRKDAVHFLMEQKNDVLFGKASFSKIDQYNLNRALSISGEWVTESDGMDGAVFSKRPILKYFYQRQPDFIHVNTDDFFMIVNPIIYTEAIKELHQDNIDYVNMRGAEIRGRIMNRIGFYTLLADNQERTVSYVRDWETEHDAFPGFDYYRKMKNNNYDLFLARGYLDINFLSDHLNVTFGYDKNFIGNGIRSLFLSDFSAPSTFLRLRSHYGKFTYENLFMELVADYQRGGDQLVPHKYAAMHQLNFNARPWLNIGLFESTIFSKQDHFQFSYLMPVILVNTAARALGSGNKTSLGLNFKAIAMKRFQFYGQGYFDQIELSELGNGSWKNQFGAQLGAKYFDAFTVSGLDIQGELNVVRPFTYSSDNETTNYTHYNQPLAHPFGAGFAEIIGLAKYQPFPKLYLSAKGIYSFRGLDSSTFVNFGNDIFKPNDQRSNGDNDYGINAGEKISGIYLNLNIAYELRPRLFLEIGANYLRRTYETGLQLPTSSSLYGGLRWNFSRKEYDSY